MSFRNTLKVLTLFQAVFVKEKTVDECLPHFVSRTSCNDDGKTIFKLEHLYREVDNLKDISYWCGQG